MIFQRLVAIDFCHCSNFLLTMLINILKSVKKLCFIYLPDVKSRPFTPPKVESDTKTGTIHAMIPNTLSPKV